VAINLRHILAGLSGERWIKRGAGKYCSRDCAAEGKSGDKNSRWTGGRYVGRDGYAQVRSRKHPLDALIGVVVEIKGVMFQSTD